MERHDHALQFGLASDLWKNLKEAVSADQIKRLSEINESDVGPTRAFAVLCTSLVAVLHANSGIWNVICIVM